jgi:hypothetical protein
MPSVNNAGRLFWGSACGSSPGGATEARGLTFSRRALLCWAND